MEGLDFFTIKHRYFQKRLKDKAMAVIHYMSGKERITKKSFPDQEFINEQRISLSVHTGTHLDAPSHFGTRCEGKKPKTIDEIPLEWCYGNGVVLNFCNKGPCEEIISLFHGSILHHKDKSQFFTN